MRNGLHEYGMFTDSGERMVEEFVAFANKFQLNDQSINKILWAIAENEVYAEASDTVVRENVFNALTNSTVL